MGATTLAVLVAILLDETILLSFELLVDIDEDVEIALLEEIEVVVGACLGPSLRFSSISVRKMSKVSMYACLAQDC